MNAASIPVSLPVGKAPPPRNEGAVNSGNDGQDTQDFAKLAGLSSKEGKADNKGDAADQPANGAADQETPPQGSGDGPTEAKASQTSEKEQPAAGSQTTAAIAALFAQTAQTATRAASSEERTSIKAVAVDALKPDDDAARAAAVQPDDGKKGAVISEIAKTVGRQQPLADGRTVRAETPPATAGAQVVNAPVSAVAGQQSAAAAVPAAPNTAQGPLRTANAAVERATPAMRLTETGTDRTSMPISITTSGLEATTRTTPAGVTVTNFWQFVAGNSGPTIVNTLPTGEAASQPAQSNQNPVSMQVQLHPKTLGTVSVAISRTGNTVTVEIIAQTRQAEQLLRSDASNLIDAFRSADGKIEEVQVRIAAASETSAAGPRGARDGEREAFGQAFGDGANLSSEDAPNDRADRDDLPDDRSGIGEFGDRRGEETDVANQRSGLYL